MEGVGGRAGGGGVGAEGGLGEGDGEGGVGGEVERCVTFAPVSLGGGDLVSCVSGVGGWWSLDGAVWAGIDLLDYGYVYWSCGAGPVDGSLLGARHLGEGSGWLLDVWITLCLLRTEYAFLVVRVINLNEGGKDRRTLEP